MGVSLIVGSQCRRTRYSRSSPYTEHPLSGTRLHTYHAGLMGWYPAVIGRAPSGAGKDNFFVPLRFLWHWWIRTLSPAEGQCPAVEQISFLAHLPQDEAAYWVLGASIGGPRSLREQLRLYRYYFLQNLPAFTLPGADYFAKHSDGMKGQKFGNCAETHRLGMLSYVIVQRCSLFLFSNTLW